MTPTVALAHIKQAVRQGRYLVHQHAEGRMRQRRVTVMDIRQAVAVAKAAAAYFDPDRVLPVGTTSWRLDSKDLDGDPLMVGVDLSVDHLGGFVVVVTVF